MHGPEILLAGEKQTTAKSLPALPEMRPAAIWHEGIQLILLTFPLGNKCLEIVWPKAFDQKKTHSQKEPPTKQNHFPSERLYFLQYLMPKNHKIVM